MHPSRDELSGLVFGKLQQQRADTVAEHLDVCPECEQFVEELEAASDEFLRTARQPSQNDPYQHEPERQQLLAVIEAIGRDRVGSIAAAAHTAHQEPGWLREYQLLAELGEGGMGKVYEALHTKLDKIVAFKVLAPECMRNRDLVTRFQREMKAVGKLDHPNIVRATDAGEVDGTHFLVMEFVDGLDLAKVARRLGALKIADACELVRQAAIGLQHAHEHGLVHRDIKPSNLMITKSGTVKILDMGLALLETDRRPGEDLTGTGQIMGTIDYMAPEQADDVHHVDSRADQYSLGCTLYKLITGVPPFTASRYVTAYQKIRAHVEEDAPSIVESRHDVPQELGAVIDRMLAKDRSDRFSTSGEVAAALAPFSAESDLPGLFDRAAQAVEPDADTRPSRSSTVSPVSSNVSNTFVPDPQPVADVHVESTIQSKTMAQRNQNGHGGRRSVRTALFGATACLLLGVVIYFNTGEGQLALTVNEDDIKVFIDDVEQTIRIASPRDELQITVPAGGHELRVVKDGFETDTKHFRIFRNGRAELTAELTPLLPVAQRPQDTHPVLTNASIDRQVAEWAFDIGGTVSVKIEADSSWDGNRVLEAVADLPTKPFTIIKLLLPATVTKQHLTELASLIEGQELAVDVLYLTGSSLTPADLAGVSGFTTHGLFLQDTPTVDEDLKHLARFDGLRFLYLDGTKVTDAGIAEHVAPLKDLTHLSLRFTSVTARGFATLRDLPQLKTLALPESISDEDLAQLANYTQLHYLLVGGNGISGRGLQVLSRLENLNHLNMGRTNVDNTSVTPLLGLKGLRRLEMGRCNITDDGFQKLGELSQLEVLFLDGANASDANIEYLSSMKNLKELRLVATKVTTAGVASLQQALPDCRIDWKDVTPDRQMAELVLNLGGSVYVDVAVEGTPKTRVRVNAVAELPAQDFQVVHVDLSDCTAADDKVVAQICELPTLQGLSLSGTSITVDGLASVARVSRLDTLRLKKTQLTDDSLRHLSHLSELRTLDLPAVVISDAGLVHLQTLKKLERLSLDGIKLTGDGLRYLRELPRLKRLALDSYDVSDRHLEDIAGIRSLESVWLDLSQVTDAGVRHLARLKNLQDLWIGSKEFTGTGVSHLQGLANLRALSLTHSGVSDDTLVHLLPFRRLEILALTKTAVTNDGLQHLKNMQQLRWLNLQENAITTSGVKELQQALPECQIEWGDEHRRLAMWVLQHGGKVEVKKDRQGAFIPLGANDRLPDFGFTTEAVSFHGNVDLGDTQLKEMYLQSELYLLDLTGTSVTSAGLRQLSGHQIRNVVLNGTAVDDTGMGFLKEVEGLSRLSLKGTAVTDAGITEIAEIAGLSALTLQNTRITDKSLESLRRLPNLTSMDLIGTQITDDGLAHLAAHDNLHTLQLQNCRHISDAGIQHLAGLVGLEVLELPAGLTDASIEHLSGLSRLTTLSFHIGSEPISDAGAKRIAELFPRLTSITLQHANLTDDGLRHLIKLNRLTQINVNGTKITDDGLAELKQLPNVEHLGLGGTSITDAGLEHLAALRNLSSLWVVSTNVTSAGVARLQQTLPDCQIVWDDPHRKLAEWVLERGGHIRFGRNLSLTFDSFAYNSNDLPTGVFRVAHIYFTEKESAITDEDITTLVALCDGIRPGGLMLNNQPITDDAIPRLKGLHCARVQFSNVAVSDVNLSHLSAVHELHLVTLQATNVTDRGVAVLAGMPRIRELYLPGNPISNDGLRHLKRLPNLQTLQLTGTHITGYGLEHLRDHKSLRSLELDACSIGDEGLQHVAAIPTLEILTLGGTKISDADLALLTPLSKLSHLRLSYTAVTDDGLVHLKSLKQLRLLELSKTAVTSEGVARLQQALPECRIEWDDPHRRLAEWVLEKGGYLSTNLVERVFTRDEIPTTVFEVEGVVFADADAAFTDDDVGTLVEICQGITLKSLAIGNQPITDLALEKLRGLRCRQIGFHNVPISDNSLHALADVENLYHLSLQATDLTDNGVAVLSRMPQIQRLYLASNSISDVGLRHLRNLPDLYSLQLVGANITGYGLEHLTVHKSLTSLELDNNSIGDEGVPFLAAIPSLEILTLGSTKIGDAGLAQLQPLSKLSRLRLRDTAVTDAGLEHLKAIKPLRSLELSKTAVTVEGVANLQQGLPECRIEWDDPHRRLAEWVLEKGGKVGLKDFTGSGIDVDQGGTLPARAFRVGNINFQNVPEFHDTHLSELGPLCRDVELNYLGLSNTSVTSAGLRHLEGLTIVMLDLNGSNVDDDGAQHIQKIHGLIHPALGQSNITDRTVAALPVTIRGLTLGDTKITDKSLGYLAARPELEYLDVISTGISDYGLEQLREHKHLHTLLASNNQIGDPGIKHLADVTSILRLELHHAKLTDAGLRQLSKLKRLQKLAISSTQITDESVKLIAESYPELASLSLVDTKVSDAGIAHLAQLKNLERLLINGTQVTDSGLAHLAAQSHLSELWLGRTAITDAGLNHLSGLRNLRRLDVQQTAVTSAGAAALQEALPDCVITFDQLNRIGDEMIIDDGDAAYAEISVQSSPGWRSGEAFVDQAYDGDYRVANEGAATARWDFKNVDAGHYDIFTTWTAAPNHADEAVYVVYDGSVEIGRTSVNQRNAPAVRHSGHAWEKLGSFESQYGQLRIELDSRISKGGQRGGVIADAVRIIRVEGPADATK